MTIKKLHALNNNTAVETTAEAAPASLDAGKPPRITEAAAPVAEEKPARKRGGRSLLLGATALVLIAAGAYYGHDYWTVGRFHISTDDAYVKADSSTIAPKVSGYLAEVLVMDNETVKAGQPLARIDDRDFKAALGSGQGRCRCRGSHGQRQAGFARYPAVDDCRRPRDRRRRPRQRDLCRAEQQALFEPCHQRLCPGPDGAAGRLADRCRPGLDRPRHRLARCRRQAGRSSQRRAGPGKGGPARSQAVQHQAELNLSHATITAPVDGTVGNRTLRVGQYVQAGTQLMSVVPTTAAYVIANYKETQLTDVKAGQPVDIEVDMFPGRTYHGHVDSLAPASGQEFALLPPDNATGNFTKVVQRIPVRIVLDGDAAANGDLRPGMSVQPSINTKNDRS
ncbi:HlyD family secretion protein [Rhizobium beringeri]